MITRHGPAILTSRAAAGCVGALHQENAQHYMIVGPLSLMHLRVQHSSLVHLLQVFEFSGEHFPGDGSQGARSSTGDRGPMQVCRDPRVIFITQTGAWHHQRLRQGSLQRLSNLNVTFL